MSYYNIKILKAFNSIYLTLYLICGMLDHTKSVVCEDSTCVKGSVLDVEAERIPGMSNKMVVPELFRPTVDFPDVPYDHLLRMAAARNPDRPAIIYHDLILTFREVVSMVNSIATGLHSLGLKKGDHMCLLTMNRPEYTTTFIGAASIGLVVSPMNPQYKEREIGYQLENSESKAILIQRELLPFYHIYGVMLTGSFLAAGATQVIMERFDLLQSLELCEKHSVTYYFAVPPIVLALANAPIDLSKMKTVKYVFSGAAPLPLDPARKLQDKTGIRVVQGYGMTEASPLTHAQPGDPTLMRIDSVGMPVHNTEQKIVDIETGEHELPPGEDGEIIIRGPQIMQGYWKAPEETARALRDGWLYTGDIGHADADGYTYIVDRKKEMIKYKGFGIAPAELESLLMEHPAVMDSAVIGVPDDEAGELPKGYVVIRQGHTATPDEILAFANGKLAGYKKIHMIEFIDAIPKVASGKILRRELKEREKALRESQME